MKKLTLFLSALVFLVFASPSFAIDLGWLGEVPNIWTNKSLPSNEQNTDPTATDDASKGYKVGDFRVNELTNTSWQCIDNTIGIAMWLPVGSGTSAFTVTGTFSVVHSGVSLIQIGGDSGDTIYVLTANFGVVTAGGVTTPHLSATSAYAETANIAVINADSGDIDGTAIGAASPSTGEFTSLGIAGVMSDSTTGSYKYTTFAVKDGLSGPTVYQVDPNSGTSIWGVVHQTASHSNAGQTVYQIDNSSGATLYALYGDGAHQAGKYVGRTITASEVLTTADFGKTFTINSGSIVYVTLPDVTTANNDSWMRFKKYGAGGFYLRCAGAEESIGDSSVSGGTVYNSSAETFANITLEVTSGVSWFITSFDGTWITP